MVFSISNCMSVGTILLTVYFIAVAAGFAYMIKKDFFDNDWYWDPTTHRTDHFGVGHYRHHWCLGCTSSDVALSLEAQAWLSCCCGPPTMLWSHISYMLSSDWPGSIGNDKPVSGGRYPGSDRYLHGHSFILHLVRRTPVVITWAWSWSHRANVTITTSWSGKPYAVTT